MSKTIEQINSPAEGKALATPQHVADEVADLMLRKQSPIAAANCLLTQVSRRSEHDQKPFLTSFENDLSKKYGTKLLPDLSFYVDLVRHPAPLSDQAEASVQRVIKSLVDDDITAIAKHPTRSGLMKPGTDDGIDAVQKDIFETVVLDRDLDRHFDDAHPSWPDRMRLYPDRGLITP
jgi:hypothetical protein